MKNYFVKSLLIICASALQFNAQAQNLLGIYAGPQRTSARYTIKNGEQPVETKTAFQAGATFKVPFEGNLYFAPALYYSQKGYQVTFLKPSNPPHRKAKNNDVTVHTIESAYMLQYDISKRASHFYVKAGPAVDYTISGKEKFDTVIGKPAVERDMPFGYTNYGRITAQGVVQVGYEMANGIFGFVHYAHGIGSMNNKDFGPQIKHRIWGLSVGYYLRRNPNVIDTRVRE